MRIWSIHPKYLDSKGLVALWRESLLAKNVLQGNTKGYKNHPQLLRFKQAESPIDCINQYLAAVYQESLDRGYQFNNEKFCIPKETSVLTVTQGQMDYEAQHLLSKLKIRDRERYDLFIKETNIDVHPLFRIIAGGVEDWEIV